MPWGYAIAAVGSYLAADAQASGAEDAANTQANATNSATAEQRRQYDQTRADYAPYRETGTRALGQLEKDINAPVTSADVMSDPGYQFGMEQGRRALSQRIAAGGGRVSGAALKAAARFGTDYSGTGYGAAYQRRQDRLNRLAALAGIGQTSTAGSAAAGANSANAISNLISSQGDAQAASQVARGSIWGNTANQFAALGQKYFDRQQTPQGYGPNGSQGYFTQFGSGGGYGSGSGGMGD